MGKIVRAAARPVITILITLIIGAVMIVNAGESPLKAYGILFYGAFGTGTGLLNTLAKATPLIFTGLAAALQTSWEFSTSEWKASFILALWQRLWWVCTPADFRR